MRSIDLNSDLGESFGAYVLGADQEMLSLVTSVNIACGFHAGDPDVMAHTVRMAIDQGVGIGAHPGFLDIQGFGRREMQVAPQEAYHLVLYQVGALSGFARAHGQTVSHVKPHGALYNMAERDPNLARAIAQASFDFDPNIVLYGLSGGQLVAAGAALGLRVAHEVFADRNYQPNGQLVSRQRPDALIHDPQIGAQRMVRLIMEGSITAIDGTELPMQADTICVHGDNAQAVMIAQELKTSLVASGISLQRVGTA
jgi:UPF0271 protein